MTENESKSLTYFQKHRAEKLQYQAQYNAAHKEAIKAYSKMYYIEHKEAINMKRREWQKRDEVKARIKERIALMKPKPTPQRREPRAKTIKPKAITSEMRPRLVLPHIQLLV